VTTVDATKKVVLFSNGHHEHYDHLITTMPLNNLLLSIKKVPRYAFHQAARKLLCNSIINFNLGFDRPNLSEKHWVYLPEKKYIPYRFGFWHNFSQSMAPPNTSALYGETSYLPRGTTVEQKQVLVKRSIEQVCSLLKIRPENIIAKKILPIPHAYVIYDQWRHIYLPKIHEALKEFSIHSIGRYGGWHYSSMQEAVLDGKRKAEAIVEKPFISSSLPAIKTKSMSIQKE
jgi:UDP-galactopyranose mutase